MKFRKKPVVIEAVQFTWYNWDELDDFAGKAFVDTGNGPYDNRAAEVYDEIHDTWIGVRAGDFIIKGLKGEFYPCDPVVFAESYEPAA